MLKIGITGGICSGKSTVCKYLEELGYKVYYSDIRAKTLIYADEKLKSEVIELIGEESFKDDVYNTDYVREIIFSDKKKLKAITKIFSKYIQKDFKKFCKMNNDEHTIFFESALIYENKIQRKFDCIVCCYASKETIRERYKNRTGNTDKELDQILNNQMDVDEKRWVSNFTINTNEDYKKQIDMFLTYIPTTEYFLSVLKNSKVFF